MQIHRHLSPRKPHAIASATAVALASAATTTVIPSTSFESFSTYWNNFYPWGTDHNGSEPNSPSCSTRPIFCMAQARGWSQLTSSLALGLWLWVLPLRRMLRHPQVRQTRIQRLITQGDSKWYISCIPILTRFAVALYMRKNISLLPQRILTVSTVNSVLLLK